VRDAGDAACIELLRDAASDFYLSRTTRRCGVISVRQTNSWNEFKDTFLQHFGRSADGGGGTLLCYGPSPRDGLGQLGAADSAPPIRRGQLGAADSAMGQLGAGPTRRGRFGAGTFRRSVSNGDKLPV